MRVLVRKQVRFSQLVSIVSETLLAHAVVRRLAVFQSFAARYVRERKQEVIDVVVVTGVERVGLADKVSHLGQNGRAQVRVFGIIRNHIEIMFGRDCRAPADTRESFGR